MRSPVYSSRKSNIVTPSPARRYRYDARVERSKAQALSRARRYPPRAMASYSLAGNKAVTTPGFPLGGKTAKSQIVGVFTDPILPANIRILNVCQLTKGDAINERERDIVHHKGWKFRVYIKNTYVVPVTFRYAFVSPRQTWNLATQATAASAFLRGYESLRAINISSVNSGLTNTKNPINDDNFMIMKTGKIDLGPNPGSTGFTGGVEANWSETDMWVPLNKQLRYAGVSLVSETPVYVVFWVDSKIRKATEAFGDISSTGSFEVRTSTIAYFHDRP